MNPFEFNSQDPVPRVRLEDVFKNGAKDHAARVDQWLGFNITESEKLVNLSKHSPELNEKETWNHLNPQIFQTSYLELRLILETVQTLFNHRPISIADLGAGYFRIEFVNKILFKEQFQITGLELCSARVIESKRVYKNFFQQDLQNLFVADITNKSCALPLCDVYFIYDFGTTHDIEILLNKICELKNKILLIARGARVRHILSMKFKKNFESFYQNQNFELLNFLF